MTALLAAISANDTIEKLGSYAGLAAIVGLGVMALLYFAQAREVKRLREWAGRAPERAAELEQRVQADAQRRVVAQPLAPATTAAQQAALSAKLPSASPVVAPPGQLARPVPPVPPATGTLPPVSGGSTTTTPSPGGASVPTPTPAPAPGGASVPTPTPAPAPATAAAQATSTPSRAPSPLDNGGGQETHESVAARPDPPLRAPVVAPGKADDGGGMSGRRIAAIVGGGVAVVIAGIVLVLAVRGGGDTTRPNDFGSITQPAATPAPAGSATAGGAAGSRVDRRATRVAVLNGTTQTGLARAVADKVEKARFTIAGTENNADQAVPATTVSFREGNERAAQIVARVLRIDRGSVQPVDANTSAAADADVIVIVGADKIG